MLSDKWEDYKLLDAGDREKLESYNGIILRRPDPMAIWPKNDPSLWDKYDAFYHRSKSGGGHWEYRKTLPEFWTISYRDLSFKVSPTNFKHTGIFPEQAYNWDLVRQLIEGKKDVKVLNLFAYSGAATCAASKAGAMEVVHVDASKGMIAWAKENAALNHLENNVIRYIEDDCIKFMKREIRRGRHYDLIIMDPPSYGRGPNNEMFKFENQINELIDLSMQLMSEKPLALIINSYTTGFSTTVLENLMVNHFKGIKGSIHSEELLLPIENSKIYLPCGLSTNFIYEH